MEGPGTPDLGTFETSLPCCLIPLNLCSAPEFHLLSGTSPRALPLLTHPGPCEFLEPLLLASLMVTFHQAPHGGPSSGADPAVEKLCDIDLLFALL